MEKLIRQTEALIKYLPSPEEAENVGFLLESLISVYKSPAKWFGKIELGYERSQMISLKESESKTLKRRVPNKL